MARFKRLIICCDGTWQASDKPAKDKNVESNVTRMCRALAEAKVHEDGDEVQQIVYYQSGIGTDIISSLGAKFAGGSGAGLAENVIEAYNFLCLNYEAVVTHDTLDERLSDEIFLFGFSRGAYTVRSLSGLISTIGILKKSSIRKIPYFYETYQTGAKNPTDALGEEDYKVPPKAVKIKVIGCWDTVGSLGIPDAEFLPARWRQSWNSRHAFHDPTLSYCVENAFHALALDEHRRPFSPTLWHLPEKEEGKKLPVLVQCWFPGVHINIGGGAKDEVHETKKFHTDRGELSDITFAWMVDLCRPYLAFDDRKPVKSTETGKTQPTYLELFKNHHKDLIEANNKGWAQGMINDADDDIMALGGSRTRAPGQYTTNNQIADLTMLEPGITDAVSSRTNEYIHPSARIRMTSRWAQKMAEKKEATTMWARDIDQLSLAGFVTKKYDLSDVKVEEESVYPYALCSGLVWVKEVGGREIRIPEYKISSDTQSYESTLLQQCPAERTRVLKMEELKFPAAPESTWYGRIGSSVSRAVLGYLPQNFHYWENE